MRSQGRSLPKWCGGALPAALMVVPWLLVAAWPMVAGMAGVIGYESVKVDRASTIIALRPMHVIALETAGYALCVVAAACVLGWPAGRWLLAARGERDALRRRLMLLLPIVTPAFVVFYTWWQAWPPGSTLFRYAVQEGIVTQLRAATLVVALACWSWPLVAWCVAASRPPGQGRAAELLRLDGAGVLRRTGLALREDARGLAVGGLIVFLLAFANTTCFDLAQVFSVGNELRAYASLGAPPDEVLRASWSAVVLAVIGGAFVWMGLSRVRWSGSNETARSRLPRTLVILFWCIWLISVVVPAVLLARGSGGMHGVRLFARLLTGPMIESAVQAAAIAAVLAVIAFGAVIAASHPSRMLRWMLPVCGATWLVLAALPGTTVAALVQSAFGRAILMSPVILVIGGAARFGFIAVLLARQSAARESQAFRACRELDGVRHPWHQILALRPMLSGAAIAAACVGWVLAFAEIPVNARLHPPGSDLLSLRLLNAMHYQREETVMVACLLMLLLAAVAAAAVAILSHRGFGWQALRIRRGAVALLLPLLLLSPAGCGLGDGEVPPLRVIASFGRPGISLGQFAYPRAIAADGERGFVYVVDKTARIQKFDLDGTPLTQWQMPESYWGKPVGLSVHPDGRVFVADTHYHRIIAFTPDGEEVLRFGTFGEEPGEFIYPTDLAFLPDGSILVSEYGGNDRIQVFSAEGVFLRTFGRFGRGPGELDRPQGILLTAEGDQLYIADACNHRLLVFDPADGTFLRAIGGAGIEPGEVHYPYDLVRLDDGTLLIAEFGNNRVQHIDPRDGRSLGIFGGLGTAEGRVQFPWGIARAGNRLFVLDSGNNRVQIMRAP